MLCIAQLDIAHDLSHPKWIPHWVQGGLWVNGHKDPIARRSKLRDCHLKLRHRMDAT
jgi:hypothetical protein